MVKSMSKLRWWIWW